MRKMIAAGAIALFLAGSLASPSIQTTHAASQIKLTVDGQSALTPLLPFYSGSILYVPVRVLNEVYPCELKWNNTLKQLTIANTDRNYVLLPDSDSIQAGENKYQLDGKVILKQGRIYIPATALNSLTGADAKLNASLNTVSIESGSVSTTVRVPTEPLAVAEEHPKVKLYAALKDRDTYKGYVLEVNGSKHAFNWQSPRLPGNPPQLYYADIDKDGQPEAVVILTLGTGTGVVAQEIHVVKPKQWTEIDVPAADKAAAAIVSSSVTKEKGDVLVHLELKGSVPQTVSLRLPGRAEDGDWGEKVGIGAVTYYGVESGRLTVDTSVNIGFAEGIGSLKVVYKKGDAGMAADSVTFIPFDEYAADVKVLK